MYSCTRYLFYTNEEESIQVFVYCYTCVCNGLCDIKHVRIILYITVGKIGNNENMKIMGWVVVFLFIVAFSYFQLIVTNTFNMEKSAALTVIAKWLLEHGSGYVSENINTEGEHQGLW